MHHNPFLSQASNKPKPRNAYEVRRVDMSQFLPELKAPQPDPKSTNLSSKSSRSRSLNNYRIRKVPQIQHPFKINNKPPEADNLVLNSKRNMTNANNNKSSVINNKKYAPAKPARNSSHLTMAYSSHSIPIRENFATEGSESDAREYNENFVPNYQKNKDKLTGAGIQEYNSKQNVDNGDPGLTANEIHEYKFLEKAQVLHIAEENESEFRSLNDTSVNHSKHEFIAQTIEDIVAKYHEGFQVSLMTRELDIVLSCNLQELKHSVDFTEVWAPFVELVSDNTLDIQKKVNILSFLFYFCEESLFSLSLDFEKIYNGITKFILEVYSSHKEHVLFYKVSKAYAELHKYFLQNLDVMDRAKLTMIFLNFLNVFTMNIPTPDQLEVFEESSLSKTAEAIPFLVLSSDFAFIIKKFLRKVEVRNVIKGEDTIKTKITELINFLSYFALKKWDSEQLAFPDKVSKIRRDLVICINNFGICLNMFKYAEIVNIAANETSGLKHPIEEIVTKILSSVGEIIANKDISPYLFGVAEEIDTKEETQEIRECLSNLVTSVKEIASNQKLYEHKGLDFNRILEGVKLLHERLQETLKQTSQEFSSIIEDLLSKPLEKLQRTIIKNIEAFRS